MRILITTSLVFSFYGIIWSQELAFETGKLDTNIYDLTNSCAAYIGLDQIKLYYNIMSDANLSAAFYNKTTSQYDVFIHETKTASFIAPDLPNSIRNFSIATQTIFNNDNNWESLWVFVDTLNNGTTKGILYSSTGSIIWSTSTNETLDNNPIYFDGTYTYLRVNIWYGSSHFYRFYRFHPSLSSANPSLSKSAIASNFPTPLISFSTSGNLRIKLVQSPAGATTVSLFNLLGQKYFSQTVSDLKKDITFTVPSYSIPGSPVITRVQNDQGISLTKSIPVK